MRRTYLGEFEEVVLLMVAILDREAYGVTVSQELESQTGRQVTFGTVHNIQIRLEEKGFVNSHLGGATAERGGRRKRFFTLTVAGTRALQDIQELRKRLWQQVPAYLIKPASICLLLIKTCLNHPTSQSGCSTACILKILWKKWKEI